MKNKKNQQGNVLFLILIAVVLFAALSYAITSSGRGDGNISKEQAKIEISKLIQQLNRYRSTHQRLLLLEGSVDYGTLGWGMPEGNTPCSTGSNCFWADEGGQIESSNRPYLIAVYYYPGIGVDGLGTTAKEPIIWYQASLDSIDILNTATACTEYNKALGVDDVDFSSANFDLLGTGNIINAGGAHTGCYLVSGTYYYYMALEEN